VYYVKPNGSLNRYKARLVALGNKKENGIDYDETFALVAKMTTVITVLSIATSKGWSLHQIDVKNVFLDGELTKYIYMFPPEDIFYSSISVCKLNRSLYGLKQAPRAWYDKFCSTLLWFFYIHNKYDSSLFIHCTPTSIILLVLYVDAMVITGSSIHPRSSITIANFISYERSWSLTLYDSPSSSIHFQWYISPST